MFLGYAKDSEGNLFIAAVAEDAGSLENDFFRHFEKIEESKEDYVLHNGKYVKRTQEAINDDIKKQRSYRYRNESDIFLFEKLDRVNELADLLSSLKEWQKMKDRIRQELPYL